MDIRRITDATYLIGGKRERRQVVLTSSEQRIILPVTPSKYQMTVAQNNKIVDVLDFGELLLFGNQKLSRIRFGSFFPATYHSYPFVVGDKRPPEDFYNIIVGWKSTKTPVRLIITDSPVNLMVAIQELEISERDGSRDIYYELTLSEYRDWNVASTNYLKPIDSITKLKDRPIIQEATNFLNNVTNVVSTAQQAYGSLKQLESIQSINLSKTIKNLTSKGLKSVFGGGWKW